MYNKYMEEKMNKFDFCEELKTKMDVNEIVKSISDALRMSYEEE